MNDDLQGQLQAYYTRAFPGRQGVQVNGLASVSAGWESDVYSFDVEHGPPEARQREELILRVYPGDDAHAKSAREFRGMRQLHRAGYPVPRVLLLERENSPFSSAPPCPTHSASWNGWRRGGTRCPACGPRPSTGIITPATCSCATTARRS